MTTFFKKISRCWIPRKSKLVKYRPQPSLFSFTVCMAAVLSFCFGFSGGYISALSAHTKDYGSIHQGLLDDLENTNLQIEAEKDEAEVPSIKEALLMRGPWFSHDNLLNSLENTPAASTKI